MPTAKPEGEIIVIGGGSAGCVIAARLAAAGHLVTLIEAGPDYGAQSSGDWPQDLLDARSLPTSHDWGYEGEGSGGQLLAFDRCQAIGGCSSHNGTTQNVGWAGDYDAWAAAGSPGWDAQSLRPLFTRALAAYQARRYEPHEIQPFHQALLAAAVAQGIECVDDFDQLDGLAGAGCSPVSNTVDGVRINAAFAYLDDLRSCNSNLTIVANSLVERIVFDGKQVTGVEFSREGVRQRINSKRIIISSGAYGSPELLLRSGVGSAQELSRLGIASVHDIPGVGRNLHDQPTAQLEFAGTAQLAAELAEFGRDAVVMDEQTIIKLRSPFSEDAPYDLHIYPWVERDASQPHGWRCIVPVGLLRPRSRGQLMLKSSDPQVRPHIDTGYLQDEDDLQRLLYGLDWAQQLVSSGPLAAYVGSPLITPADSVTQEQKTAWIRANHTHYWHPAGTCKMGPASDPDAVVEHTGKVHGLDGLYVADASVFPDVPRGTTALASAVVGERIALFLMDEFK
ncbi:GMC family oxidoreductase [Pseudomonas sp. NPDC078700]|uniref:GMC family oxidoreductase n=1 Tax=Pseudomonas sp. NPDC078700 TaxID=3364424 RepID=UPI0037C9D2A9